MNEIEITDFGAAILKGDSHVSTWVKECKTIEIAKPLIDSLGQFIPEGGTVVDAGANIGDHTVTYAKKVGPMGRVVAFEPRPDCCECILKNTSGMENVTLVRMALGDRLYKTRINTTSAEAAGMAFLDEAGDFEVEVTTLDAFHWDRLDFIKIDVEGFEPLVLKGGHNTITQFMPAMYIETYDYGLNRIGWTIRKLLDLIESYGYQWKPEAEGIDLFTLGHSNVICTRR